MSRKRMGRALAGLALAAVLALAGPAPAGAAERPGAGLWNWLENLWTYGVSALWRHEPAARPRDRAPAGSEKEGACIDPNGCANTQTPGGQGAACSSFNDQGACIDPNG